MLVLITFSFFFSEKKNHPSPKFYSNNVPTILIHQTERWRWISPCGRRQLHVNRDELADIIDETHHITMSSSSHTPPPNNNNNFKTRNAAGRRCQRNNQSNERLRINLVSLLVTCVVLFAGVKLADGSFIRNINRISETLDRALFNVLEELEGPDYTAINVSATYYASTRFNPEGMAILYNLTNIFMDVLVNRDVYPEGN